MGMTEKELGEAIENTARKLVAGMEEQLMKDTRWLLRQERGVGDFIWMAVLAVLYLLFVFCSIAGIFSGGEL